MFSECFRRAAGQARRPDFCDTPRCRACYSSRAPPRAHLSAICSAEPACGGEDHGTRRARADGKAGSRPLAHGRAGERRQVGLGRADRAVVKARARLFRHDDAHEHIAVLFALRVLAKAAQCRPCTARPMHRAPETWSAHRKSRSGCKDCRRARARLRSCTPTMWRTLSRIAPFVYAARPSWVSSVRSVVIAPMRNSVSVSSTASDRGRTGRSPCRRSAFPS